MYTIGKLLLCGAIIAHGLVMIQDESYGIKWDKDVKNALKIAPIPNDIKDLVNQHAHNILLAIAGLQILSFLNILFKRAQCIAVFNIIGFFLICAVKCNPLLASNPKDREHAIQECLKYLALVGGLLWYCSSSRTALEYEAAAKKDKRH